MQAVQLEIARSFAHDSMAWLRSHGSPARVSAGALSALLHLALLVFLFAAGEQAGDPRSERHWFGDAASARAPGQETFVGIQQVDAAAPITREPAEPTPQPKTLDRLTGPATSLTASFGEAIAELIAAPRAMLDIEETPSITPADLVLPPTEQAVIAQPSTRPVEVTETEHTMLLEQVTNAAQALANQPELSVSWTENGQPYTAVLTRNAGSSTDLERVVAKITTTTQGASLQTRLTMNRLAFSQFSQLVDRWDFNVQLHDDEIDGRFHSNSSFFVASDSSVKPKLAGKVTTAARSLRVPGGGRRRAEIFQGGLETSAKRIDLPKEAQPFFEAAAADGHVKTFEDDAHVTLHADGSYSWQARKADLPTVQRYEIDEPVYLLAARGVTLYVRGTVRGRVLLYSPDRIVVEGNVRYANDPRADAAADDYLGLIADRYVEIARPYVTGRGDLQIDAAIFARKRFVVSDIDYFRTATLTIYGSLTAGTISATEPRYATRIQFDPRFDRVRPPGFPSTNRYELAEWNTQWSATSAQE